MKSKLVFEDPSASVLTPVKDLDKPASEPELLESPVLNHPIAPVCYRMQAPFKFVLENRSQELEEGEVIERPYLINKLLALGAPMLPLNAEEVHIIFCPKCGSKLNIADLPGVKDWMSRVENGLTED